MLDMGGKCVVMVLVTVTEISRGMMAVTMSRLRKAPCGAGFSDYATDCICVRTILTTE